MTPFLAFTEEQAEQAHAEWGANCGPGALAACLGRTLADVRPLLPAFPARGYTNVTMMREAVERAGFSTDHGIEPPAGGQTPERHDWWPVHGLVRIQIGGPWTAPGANGKWASCHTHWVASKHFEGEVWVFDINGGWLRRRWWQDLVMGEILLTHERSDGQWWPTHVWEVRKR